MDLREILFAQFPAFFLLSLLFLAAHLRVRPLRLPPAEQGISLLLIVHLPCLSFPAALPGGGAARVVDDRPRKRTLLGKNGRLRQKTRWRAIRRKAKRIRQNAGAA